MATLLDKLSGSLIGLAVGDAVGTTVEFKPRGSFPPVTDMTGGGPFKLPVGYWTDDTSMALCIADSLRENNGLDENDLLSKFVDWHLHGYNSSTGRCFDIGNTTINALHNYIENGSIHNNDNAKFYSGNGSIMRLAPVAIYYHADPEMAVTISAGQSKTTHAALPAVHGCELLAMILLNAFSTDDKDQALNLVIPAHWDPLVVDVASMSFLNSDMSQIKSSGYVIDTLKAAIWSFYNTNSFSDAILTAANLGDDADTVAAVTGQIAGAFYGESSIPDTWIEKLHDYNRIKQLAIELAKKGGFVSGH